MNDYMLTWHGYAICCGTRAYCKAQAIWRKLPDAKIIHCPPALAGDLVEF